MKTALRLAGLLSLLLFAVGFSYSLALDGEVTVDGSAKLGAEALNKTVLESGGKLVHSPDGKAYWYVIDGVSVTFTPTTETRISIKASIFMGNGCARSKAMERARELLGKLVAQASRESGIGMQMSEVREVGSPPAH